MKQKASREVQPGIDNFKYWVFTCVVGSRPNSDPKGLRGKSSPRLVVISLIFLLFTGLDLTGQTPGVLFDTIRFERDGNTGYDYLVSNATTKVISYNKSHFKKCKGNRFSIAGEAGRELLTAITGIGTGVDKDVNWLLAGKIKTDDPQRDWKVEIYCPGSIHKSKERVRNNDGSFSTENSRDIEVNWEESMGYIINQSDTVGSFCVVNEPRDVPELNKWTKVVYSRKMEGRKAMVANRMEFALWGDLYGQQIMIMYNAENNLIYLFKDTELSGIFQPEQRKVLVRKKKIKKPFLLVDNTLHEEIKSDVLLLSMLGQWFMVSSNEPQ